MNSHGGPETLRLCGELRLGQTDTLRAESDFRESIKLSRSMSARGHGNCVRRPVLRGFSLHKAIANEARVMLAEIYNRFTKGFDTADLIDAKGFA